MHKANKRCLKFLLLAHLRWPWTLSFSAACVSSFWQHAEFAVLARRECVTCTHAASSSLSAPRVYVFYKFSSSKKNNERARHVLCEHPYVALLQRARWCTHECAHLRFIFYCTIKRPSNNNNSHVTEMHTRKRRFGKIWNKRLSEPQKMPQGWTNDKELSLSACHF